MVYVTSESTDKVHVIDGSINSVIDYIPVNSPFEMAINPSSNKVYVIFYETSELTVIEWHEPSRQESPIQEFEISVILGIAIAGVILAFVVLTKKRNQSHRA